MWLSTYKKEESKFMVIMFVWFQGPELSWFPKWLLTTKLNKPLSTGPQCVDLIHIWIPLTLNKSLESCSISHSAMLCREYLMNLETSKSTFQGEKRRKVNKREKNLFSLFIIKNYNDCKLQRPVGTYEC